MELIGKGYETERQIPLHTVFLNPHLFYENSFDLLLRGLVRERAQSVDSYITDEVMVKFLSHNPILISMIYKCTVMCERQIVKERE